MVECWLPYGDTEVYLTVNMKDLLGVSEPKIIEPQNFSRELINNSFNNLKGSKKLEELVSPDCDVCIALEGTTNSKVAVEVLSYLVDQLVNLIVPKEKITIIIANGIRERSSKGIINEIKKSENLKSVNLTERVKSTSNYSDLGKTHQGTIVQISKIFAEAKIKIAIGETHLDNYTGFSGAHTALLPGLASEKTIEDNRRLYFKGDIKPGVIEFNSLKEDVIEAVKMIKVDLAINLLVNSRGKLYNISSGSIEESWGQAIYELGSSYNFTTETDPDIVVISAGGNKYDYDLYNSIPALKTASKIVKKGGAIILLAECQEGLGVDAFTNMARIEQLSEIERRYRLGAEAVHMLKTSTQKSEVVLVSSLPKYVVDQLGIQVARTVNMAYEKIVENRRGKRTLVIPQGILTYPNNF